MVKPPPLHLKEKERVRVKSIAAIRAMLDSNWRFEGLAFFRPMERYCGGTYRVRQRIELFFDERTRRMLKPRNVVVLEGVFCEPSRDSNEEYAGCQRGCFLFWKEAWLDRV